MNAPQDHSGRPPETRVGAQALLIAAAVVLGTALSLRSLTTPGYALDEDLTALTVAGISRTGLPVLPSGVLNVRGVLYSYLAWFSGVLFGDTLNAYRLISVLSGAVTIVAMYNIAARISGQAAAFFACVLVATFPLQIASTGWARFYALATAAITVAVIALLKAAGDRPPRTWRLAGIGLSLLTHELGALLMVLPGVAALASGGKSRRRWMQLAVVSAGYGAAALLLVLINSLAPSRSLNPTLYRSSSVVGAQSIAEFQPLAPIFLARPATILALAVVTTLAWFRWGGKARIFAAACGVTVVLFQLGVLGVAIPVAILLRPDKARTYAVCAAAAAVAAIGFWSVHTAFVTSASLTPTYVMTLAQHSWTYPLEAFRFFGVSLPITAGLIATAATSIAASNDDRRIDLRMLFALLIVVGTGIGGIRQQIQARYFVLFWPIVMIVAMHGVNVVSSALSGLGRPRSRVFIRGTAIGILLVAAAMEHQAFAQANPVIALTDRGPRNVVPRVPSQEWAPVLAAIPRDAIVVTNDEVASSYNLGRVDYWLSTQARDLTEYALRCPSGPCGLYGGSPIVSTPEALAALLASPRQHPLSVVLFETGRFEYEEYVELLDVVLNSATGGNIERASHITAVTLPATR